MKTLKRIFIASLALFAMVSCAKEPAEGGSGTMAISIESAAVDGTLSTRVADVTGYEGVVKKEFVVGDAITVIYNQENQSRTGRAQLTISGWVTYPRNAEGIIGPIYITESAAEITSNFTKNNSFVKRPNFSYVHDNLTASASVVDGTITNGGQVDLTFSHTNAMVMIESVTTTTDPTPMDLDGAFIYATMIRPNNDTVFIEFDEYLQVITQVNARIDSVFITIPSLDPEGEDMIIEAESKSIVRFERGKQYPLNILIYEEADGGSSKNATITIGGISEWETTEVPMIPAGYDCTVASNTELRAFGNAVNNDTDYNGVYAKTAKVIQTTDIVMDNTVEWPPIDGFEGEFNGNGYKITNLLIDGDAQYAGLFGTITSEATLQNIHLRDVAMSPFSPTNEIAGALVGKIDATGAVTVRLCSATGTVLGGSIAGGLIGSAMATPLVIERSRANVDVSVEGTGDGYLGGFIGSVSEETDGSAQISFSAAEGKIGEIDPNITLTGGFIGGVKYGATISYCYAAPTVTPVLNGLTGFIRQYDPITNGLTISNSYCTVGLWFIYNYGWSANISLTNCWKPDGTYPESTDYSVEFPNGAANLTPDETVIQDGDPNAGYWKAGTEEGFPVIDYTYTPSN